MLNPNTANELMNGAQPTSWLPVYEVTPELAKMLLERNEGNRGLRQHVIERYSEDMKAGRWHFLGDPLVFDEDGILRQGQHRLHSLIKAQMSILIPVVTGVPRLAFAAIDTGSKRSPGDQMKIVHGVSNPSNLAAMIPRYLDLISGKSIGSHSRNMSPTAIVSWYEEHAEMHEALHEAVRVASAVNDKLYAPPGITGACFVWIREVDEEGAEFFFRRSLIDGFGWNQESSPARTLGQFMTQYRGLSTRDYENELAWCILRCWDAWARGEGIKLLRPYKDGRMYPRRVPTPRKSLACADA